MVGSPRLGVGRRAVAFMVAVVLGMSACRRAYLYDGAAPPTLEDNVLVVGDRQERFRVKSVSVLDAEDWERWRRASSDELDYLRAGSLPPSASAVRVTVDNSSVIWGEWAMGGFGLGVTTAFGLLATLGALSPNANQFQSLDFGIAASFALAFGLEMALIGAGLGELFAGQDVDMRSGDLRE